MLQKFILKLKTLERIFWRGFKLVLSIFSTNKDFLFDIDFIILMLMLVKNAIVEVSIVLCLDWESFVLWYDHIIAAGYPFMIWVYITSF